jgi:hypothetical protein
MRPVDGFQTILKGFSKIGKQRYGTGSGQNIEHLNQHSTE